jgi:hypothetical protein
MTLTANSQDSPLLVPKTRCQLRVVQTPPPLGIGGGRKGRGCRPQVRWRGRVRRGHGLKSRCGGRPWRRLAGGGRAAGAWCVRSAGCPDCPPVMVPTGCQDGRAASDWPPMMGPRPLGPEATLDPEATPCLLPPRLPGSTQPPTDPRAQARGQGPLARIAGESGARWEGSQLRSPPFTERRRRPGSAPATRRPSARRPLPCRRCPGARPRTCAIPTHPSQSRPALEPRCRPRVRTACLDAGAHLRHARPRTRRGGGGGRPRRRMACAMLQPRGRAAARPDCLRRRRGRRPLHRLHQCRHALKHARAEGERDRMARQDGSTTGFGGASCAWVGVLLKTSV